MNMRMIVEDNQQVMEGSGRTSLYLLAATLVFLALMALAWISPSPAHAQTTYGGGDGAMFNGGAGRGGAGNPSAGTATDANGLDVTINTGDISSSFSNVIFKGGDGADDDGTGAGGDGGDTALGSAGTPFDALTITGNALTLASGSGGDAIANNGGAGGKLEAHIKTLRIASGGNTNLTFTRGAAGTASGGGGALGAAGSISASITTLDIAAGTNVTWVVTDTTAGNWGLSSANNTELIKISNIKLNGNTTLDGGLHNTTVDNFGEHITMANDASGNRTLNIAGVSNALKNMNVDYASTNTSFTNINFDLADLVNNGVMLSVNSADNSSLDYNGGSFRSKVTVNFDALDNYTLTTLRHVTLIDGNGSNFLNTTSDFKADGDVLDTYDRMYGLTDYHLTVLNEKNDRLGLTVDRDGYYEPYYEGMLGGHLAVREGYRNVLNTITENTREKEMGVIIVKLNLEAADLKTKTNSHVNSDYLSTVLSLAWRNQSAIGETTVGAFAEAGTGGFDTYNGLHGAKYYGDGQTEYYGGGLFFHNLFNSNTYVEASVRAGSLNNDYDVRKNYHARFDTDQTYYGAHIGVGQKIALTDCAELDLYFKNVWTRTESKNIRTRANERFHFDAVDSFRTILGGRLTQGFDDDHFVKGYVGAAWEHEFDGKVEAGRHVNGIRNNIDSPDLKGSSAFGEAGFIIDPPEANYTIDVGIFGLAGTQRGFGGTAGIKFEF